MLEEAGLGKIVVEELGLDRATLPDLAEWHAITERIRGARIPLTVGLVGKYIELQDAYLSVAEAVRHAAWAAGCDVKLQWIDSERLERSDDVEPLVGLDGLVVPGGFGYRGIEGKVKAARFGRERRVPTLGLCMGMQCMVIELARTALGTDDANSTEFDAFTPHPVIDLLPEQRDVADKGGTMRLGSYPCVLEPGSLASRAYGQPIVLERHRHRFEFNNAYRDLLQSHGMRFTGLSPDGRLVEMAEVVSERKDDMLVEGRRLASWHENVIVKVPMTPDGIAAGKALGRDGIRVNVTLCFSVNQALLAAAIGAYIVSPFAGRLDDINEDGMRLVADIVSAYRQQEIKTKVLAASIRSPVHVTQAALAGADIATMPFAILKQLFNHPLTEAGQKRFLEDYQRAKAERDTARAGSDGQSKTGRAPETKPTEAPTAKR